MNSIPDRVAAEPAANDSLRPRLVVVLDARTGEELRLCHADQLGLDGLVERPSEGPDEETLDGSS
jgi:hypothetical protein